MRYKAGEGWHGKVRQYNVVSLQSVSSVRVISLVAWCWAKCRVVCTGCAVVQCEMPSPCTFPVTTHPAISPLRSFSEEVRTCLQSLQAGGCSWASAESRCHCGADGLRQACDKLPSKGKVGHWLETLLCTHQLVQDETVHHCNFQNPEKNFPPPLHRLVQEAVVAHELVQFVHP